MSETEKTKRKNRTEAEKAEVGLAVLQRKIDKLRVDALDLESMLATAREQLVPLLERREYLLKDPVLTDEIRDRYRDPEEPDEQTPLS